ncbi:MAG TPA: protein-methionine-sulfoxide reductase heme-binding subunit MsrQ [Gemmatimonadaceae bacterium]|nr:protein-methionine-sulfoxide reductase heme-binding subunit MsrQ [Gemmatimonadaceae bacterium]
MKSATVIARLKPAAFALCLVPALLLAWNFWGVTHDRPEALGAEPVREAEVFTGLWTLRFLAITLAVTPVRELLGIGALARYRRMFGLFTFFYACVHLSMWVGVDWFFDWRAMGGEIAKHKYILIGMTTFVLLIPLALTSTKGSVRRLGGARWARWHRLIYVCAITGTVHYLWAVKKDTLFPLVYLFVFVVLLGFRLWERYVGPLRLRGRRASRAAKQPSVLTDVVAPEPSAIGDAK